MVGRDKTLLGPALFLIGLGGWGIQEFVSSFVAPWLLGTIGLLLSGAGGLLMLAAYLPASTVTFTPLRKMRGWLRSETKMADQKFTQNIGSNFGTAIQAETVNVGKQPFQFTDAVAAEILKQLSDDREVAIQPVGMNPRTLQLAHQLQAFLQDRGLTVHLRGWIGQVMGMYQPWYIGSDMGANASPYGSGLKAVYLDGDK